MSASEKLLARMSEVAQASSSDEFVDAVDHLALPQIVAVVKAAEEATRYDYCYDDVGDDGAGMCSSTDGEYVEWREIGDALAALNEALQ